MAAPDGQRCETCRYFTARSTTIAGENLDGRCDRYPPTVMSADIGVPDLCPSVAHDDWCGEYAPDAPQTITEGAATLARLVLLGDLVAARALADKLREDA